MKKIIALLCACLLLTSLSACEKAEGDPSSSAVVEESPSSSPAEPVPASNNARGYEGLTGRQKEIYDQIVAAARELEMDEIALPEGSSMEDIDQGFNAAMEDHPSIFWIAKEYTVRSAGGATWLRLAYLVDGEDELQAQQAALDAAVTEAMGLIAGVTEEFEKELILHDWLIRRVSYSDEAAADTSGNSASAYTAYGALVEGKAVCEGYARGMQLLLEEVGIPCTLLSGLANGADHMWNVVTVNGRDYHLDPTWNDVIHPDNGQDVSHIYFNVTDEELSLDHSDFEASYCNSSEDNFFVKTGRLMESYGEDGQSRIAALLKEMNDRGETILEIRFTDRDAYLAAGKDLFQNYGIFNVLKKANELCGGGVYREDSCKNGDLESSQNVLTIIPQHV